MAGSGETPGGQIKVGMKLRLTLYEELVMKRRWAKGILCVYNLDCFVEGIVLDLFL